MVLSYCSHTEDGEKVYTVELTEDEFNLLEALGGGGMEALREMCNPFKTISDLTDEQVERIKASFIKDTLNTIYGASATKTVHPDEDCVLPGCDRYGGNDTYLRIRKVLGHTGAFDFCMGNVIKLVDRWEKKGDPAQNLEKLRDYSAQALVEWRLWNEKLS